MARTFRRTRSTRRTGRWPALALLFAATAPSIATEPTVVQVKTADGCIHEYLQAGPQRSSSIPGMKMEEERSWSGRCVDGKLQGFGELVFKSSFSNDTLNGWTVVRTRGHAWEGRFQGFLHTRVESSSSREPTESWGFVDGLRRASFGGVALEGYPELLKNRREFLPRRTTALPDLRPRSKDDVVVIHTLGDEDRLLFLAGGECIVHQQDFPDCKLDSDNRSNFRVHYFQLFNTNEIKMDTPHRFCPVPRDAGSCAQMLEPMTAPLVKSIERNVQAFFDRLELEPRAIRAALQEYGSAAAAPRP